MSNALLYRADAVRAVLERMDPPCEIRVRTGRPIFVARVAPRTPDPDASWRSWRGADVLAPRAEHLDAMRGWWHLGFRLEVLGAEIRDIDESLYDEGEPVSDLRRSAARTGPAYTRRARAFVLGDPGAWFDDQLGRRFSTGAGGPFRLVHGRNPDLAT